jgi:hypothetical protein
VSYHYSDPLIPGSVFDLFNFRDPRISITGWLREPPRKFTNPVQRQSGWRRKINVSYLAGRVLNPIALHLL